jgi:hypothetical protein
MNKILLYLCMMLIAFNSFAGVCNNGSLKGAYSYSLIGMTDTGYGIFGAGQLNSKGNGTGTISGIGSYFGVTSTGSGSFTYSVSALCVTTGTITTTNGVKTTFWLYLDRMDASPAVKVAYHGNLVAKNSVGSSFSGMIDKVDGKF